MKVFSRANLIYFFILLLIVATIALINKSGDSVQEDGEIISDGLVLFQPVYFNDHSNREPDLYIIGDEKMSSDFYMRLEYVLEFYGIGYLRKDDVIFVSRDLASDKDYMANLTKKALDDSWLKDKGYALP